ncbi:MAG: hypothetical protein IJO29_01450 [Oscillospiraceae bacterium]|nr:hypothetical protein [Oscillospiraceae bacterium]
MADFSSIVAKVAHRFSESENKEKVVIIIISALAVILLIPIIIVAILVTVFLVITSAISTIVLGGNSESESDSAQLSDYVTEGRCELGRDNKAIYRGIPIAASQKSAAHKTNAAYYIDDCIVDSSDGVYCFQTQPKQL